MVLEFIVYLRLKLYELLLEIVSKLLFLGLFGCMMIKKRNFCKKNVEEEEVKEV